MKRSFRFKKSLAIMTFLLMAVSFGIVLSGTGQSTLPPEKEGLVTIPFKAADAPLKAMSEKSDRYYVLFKSTPTALDESAIVGKGAEIRHRFSLVPAYSAVIPDQATVDSIKSEPNVEAVEKVSAVQALVQLTPWGIKTVKAPLVWDTTSGAEIRVCVLDTGIDYNHADLSGNYGGGYDFVNNDPDPWDDHGHGTHCAGTVAAVNNGIGVIGTAYDATLYSCKVLNAQGYGYSDDILAGVEWAVNNGMHVASMSLGGGGYSPIEEQAYQEAYEAGLLIVCASGNDGDPVVLYPARYASNIAVGSVDQNLVLSTFSNYGADQELVAPGEYILSTEVTGTGFETWVAEGGNGYEAPGMTYAGLTGPDGITATAYDCGLGEDPSDFPPEVSGNIALIQRGNITFAQKTTNAMNAGAVAVIIYNNQTGLFLGTLGSPGAWVPVVSMSEADGAVLVEMGEPTVTLMLKVGDYGYRFGTSMACPHVAGVAALVMAANDSLTNVEVRQILDDTATDLGDPGWDPLYGYGLVNAEAAVEEALSMYMYINNIRMRAVLINGGVQVYAYVEIRNYEGNPVANATVHGEWSGDVPADIHSTGITGLNGIAVLQAPFIPPHTFPDPQTITVTVHVTDVQHSYYIYNPAMNQVPPEASITVTY